MLSGILSIALWELGSGKWHKNMLILWPLLLTWVLIKCFVPHPGVSIFLPESMKLWQANMLASSNVISQVFDSFSDKGQVVIETCLSRRERMRAFHFKSILGNGDAITSYNIHSTIQITSKFLPQTHPQKHPLCSNRSIVPTKGALVVANSSPVVKTFLSIWRSAFGVVHCTH